MQLRDFGQSGIQVPVIGQGTWNIGESVKSADEEIQALRLGIELGMTHIDTAEMYGNGRAEELVGRAIEWHRQEIFLASKVLPSNASFAGTISACERSLTRLRTDYLDLYMLHWWSGRHPIQETMRAMDKLVREGKVRRIGVSNLEVAQLQQAQGALENQKIACNQVCYHLEARGIEVSLIPYCRRQGIAVVGYSPFGSGKFPDKGHKLAALTRIGSRHGRTERQVALNFLIRIPGCFTIPKAANVEHVRENADATGWELSPDDLKAIDEIFPAPTEETPLEMI
jgi:diketogulonate reductase-like aldo/keto reductase